MTDTLAASSTANADSSSSSDEFAFSFGECRLDMPRRELRVRGNPVALQPRVFDLLVYFIRHPRVVHGKTELIAAVWPTRHVTEDVLSTAVRKLRRAIGDDGTNESGRIVSVFGVGYRFDAQVTVERRQSLAPCTIDGSLAVLRVLNETGDPSLAWVDEGLACLIHYQMSRIPGLELQSLAVSLSRSMSPHHLPGASASVGGHPVMACRLVKRGATLVLQADIGTSPDDMWTRHIEGTDIAVIALTAAHAVAAAAGRYFDEIEVPGDWTVRMRLGVAAALSSQGRIDSAVRLIQSLQPRDCTSFAVRVLGLSGRLPEATRVMRLALGDAGCARSISWQLERARLALSQWEASEMVSARDDLERCIDGGQSATPRERALALALAGELEARTGVPSTGIGLVDRALRLADKEGDPQTAVEVRLSLAVALVLNSDFLLALSLSHDAEALARQHRLPPLRGLAWARCARVYRQMGQLEKAEAAARLAMDLLPPTADVFAAARAMMCSCEIRMARGEIDEVADLMAQISAVSREAPNDCIQVEYELLLCAWHWYTGQSQYAADRLEAVLDDPRLRRLPSRVQRDVQAHAIGLFLASGRFDRARVLLNEARDDLSADQRCLAESRWLFATDQREACKKQLREGLVVAQSAGEGNELRLFLAWLNVEDGESASAAVLIADLHAMGVDLARLRFLSFVLQLRDGHAEWSDSRWRTETATLEPAIQFTAAVSSGRCAAALLSGSGVRLTSRLPIDPGVCLV